MRKLIATAPVQERQFNIGQVVEHESYWHDGRTYVKSVIKGEVIKIHKVNMDIKLENGNVYRVDKKSVK